MSWIRRGFSLQAFEKSFQKLAWAPLARELSRIGPFVAVGRPGEPQGEGEWAERVLHNFGGGTDGAEPFVRLESIR
jgi:hypothetical protein